MIRWKVSRFGFVEATMSYDLIVYLRDIEMPTPSAWQTRVAQASFSFPIELSQDFDPRAMTGFLPVNYTRNSNTYFTSPTLNLNTGITMQAWTVDENYIPTLDLKVTEGRNFSQEFPTDSTAVIINEAAAKFLATKDLLNKNIYTVKKKSLNKN